MSLKGSLRDAPLPDVLQLLAMGRKTGCLSLAHRGNFGSIYFESGRITYASIVNRRDRLGERLVQSGEIERDVLNAAMAAQAVRPGARLGDVLVEQGSITPTVLREHLAVQVQETVYLLYAWTDGTFAFDVGAAPHADNLVAIAPESLMLEGARRADEWTLIQESVPAFDLVFELMPGVPGPSLEDVTLEQRAVLEVLDGERDVAAIADASGLSEFEAGKALHELRGQGLVRQREVAKRGATLQPQHERVDEHRNLGVAFYRARMFDEALREFRRVLELDGSDRDAASYCGRIHLHQEQWQDALDLLVPLSEHPDASLACLGNVALALERLGRYAEARTALVRAINAGGDGDPRLQTSLGIVLLYLGDAADADAAFAAARAGSTKAPAGVWSHYASLAAAWLGDLSRARALLEDAVERGAVPAAYCNLAALLEQDGVVDEALAAASRALMDANPPAQAHKNLGDLYYGARRYDEAHDAFAAAIERQPDLGSDVYQKLGNIALRRRRPDEAMSHWRRALQLDPANQIVRMNLDTLMRSEARLDRAS